MDAQWEDEVVDDDARIRIVIAEADPLARRSLRDAVANQGMTVVAEASTGQEAIDLAAFYRPDVVLMDDRPPSLDGVAAARSIHEPFPDVRVVLLAGEPDDRRALEALRAGAAGYLSRDFEPAALPRILRGALGGEAAISRRLAMSVIESYRRAPRGRAGLRPVRSPLTDREWEVLDLLAGGAGTEEIARTLVLSTETVRSHLKNLFRKLDVRSREQAVREAERLRDAVV
jgi:DNA-binding NarL/FixJ family response regulator